MSTATTPAFTQYVPYNDSVEVKQPNEEQTFEEVAQTLRQVAATLGDRARHAARAVHAKSHGLLKGTLTVLDDLPAPFAQGLFAKSGSYPVILRFSTNPGDMLPDSISTPRGLAVKVIGVEGEMLEGHAGETNQDFVFVNAKVFGAANANDFLKQVKLLAQHATDSEGLKQFVSTTARLAEQTLEAVGSESGLLKGFGHPNTHPLGETYCSQAPLRYGNYIAKICIAPQSENLHHLTKKHIAVGDKFSALRDEISNFFEHETAVWEVKAQLCTNLEKMPVEDASVEWPESESPYVPVAQITALAQNSYSPERRVYVDELLSFSPWQALAAHRPLGNIMRARKRAYVMSSKFRHMMNGRPSPEPKSITELPD